MGKQPGASSSAHSRVELRAVASTSRSCRGPHGPFGSARRFAFTYNGTTPGPTLRARPGDTLTITLVNHLDAPTNLHTHGLHVSPSGTADNVSLVVPPGSRHRYIYEIPLDHRSGLFWYHPHHHGSVANQVYGGLAGAIIVEDGLDDDRDLQSSRERIMILADPAVSDSAGAFDASMMDQMRGREGDDVVVNGIVAPRIVASAGTLERWRLLNASAARYYRIVVEGHTLRLIGTDGDRLRAPIDRAELLMAPGERAELPLAPDRGHNYDVSALPYDRGTAMMGGGEFTIDGRSFDARRTDITTRLDTIEDWIVDNTSSMDHPFHLHAWPFQVLDDGNGIALPGWKDTLNVPAGQSVRLRVAFRDLGGRTVYHCHILDHEDLGMMGVIDVS